MSAGRTGHAEAVQVAYDPAKVSYEKLLEVFWRNVDPTDAGGQFCDRGTQYRTGIFYRGRDAEARGRGVEARARSVGTAAEAARHRDRPPRGLLPGGGLPPGLLQEEPGPLHELPRGLRPGPAPRGAVGEGSDPRAGGVPDGRDGQSGRRQERVGGCEGRTGEAGEGRAQEGPDAAAVQGDAGRRDRVRVPQRVLEQPRARDLRGRRLRRAALLLARQVRLGHGLAELHAPAREGQRQRHAPTPPSG